MEDLTDYLPEIVAGDGATDDVEVAASDLASHLSDLKHDLNTPCNPEYPMQSTTGAEQKASKRKHCGAKRRDGKPCRAWAMSNGRCRMHGGASPKGAAHPRTTSGRYSRDLPTRLRDRYEEAIADASLLELAAEAALLDARLGEILARLDRGESGELWGALEKEAQAAQRYSKDPDRARSHLAAVFRLIQQGAQERERWDEITDLIEYKRKLAETERKRLRDSNYIITVQQLNVLLAFILDSIKRHVSDGEALRAISSEFDRFIAGSLQRGPAARA